MSRFHFKHFSVEQQGAKMKIGTDGVLLGAWVRCNGVERVLDAGTGTGVIALMLAQRSEAVDIVGIDIDSSAAQCAADNFAFSPWSERLTAVATSVQEYYDKPFDLVVTNPPYFSHSLLCPDTRRTMARHTTKLSFEQLDAAVTRLLSPHGTFALILPTEQMEHYLTLTTLHLHRRCDVSTKPDMPPKRTMVELRHRECESVEQTYLTIETSVSRTYTEQYRTLTRDFYLKF